MDWLIAIQRWLYGGFAEQMRSATDWTVLPGLISLAFVFGMVHALMPGHGKSVLVSYHASREGRWFDGLATGALLGATHVGTAVILVLAGVAVISRTLSGSAGAPQFELASAAFIVLIGLVLSVRAMVPRSHAHGGDGKVLAVVTGLVPCPLTTFILTYAMTRGQLAIGMAAVFGMLLGVIATLSAFAVAAVLARRSLMAAMAQSAGIRLVLGRGLEIAGALGVLALGVILLARAAGKV